MATPVPSAKRAKEIKDAMGRVQVEKFEPKSHEWEYYIAQFETQLHIHRLIDPDAADARRDLLLSSMGTSAFKILVDQFSPDPPITKSYDDLKGALQRHCGKKTCILAERKTFQLRMRKKNEDVTTYLNELRKIASKCRFGQSINERLRDQLVIGINNSDWQTELFRQFQSDDGTLEQVETAALNLERTTIKSEAAVATATKSKTAKAADGGDSTATKSKPKTGKTADGGDATATKQKSKAAKGGQDGSQNVVSVNITNVVPSPQEPARARKRNKNTASTTQVQQSVPIQPPPMQCPTPGPGPMPHFQQPFPGPTPGIQNMQYGQGNLHWPPPPYEAANGDGIKNPGMGHGQRGGIAGNRGGRGGRGRGCDF